MTYRVYSGPRGSQSISPLEKDRHLYKEFGSLDEAMNWARHINDSGRVALLIEGDDGTRLTKQQIVTALKNPEEPKSLKIPKTTATRLNGPESRPLGSRVQKRREAGNHLLRRLIGVFIRGARPVDPERFKAERHRAHDVPSVGRHKPRV